MRTGKNAGQARTKKNEGRNQGKHLTGANRGGGETKATGGARNCYVRSSARAAPCKPRAPIPNSAGGQLIREKGGKRAEPADTYVLTTRRSQQSLVAGKQNGRRRRSRYPCLPPFYRRVRRKSRKPGIRQKEKNPRKTPNTHVSTITGEKTLSTQTSPFRMCLPSWPVLRAGSSGSRVCFYPAPLEGTGRDHDHDHEGD